jgi:osmotically-inducible protein OsmY
MAQLPVDRRLTLEVERVLREYEPLRASRAPLIAEVFGGRVRLLGRTRSLALRIIAGYIVSFVPGVEAIDNEVLSDDQVIRAVADALAADPLTAPQVLRVNCRYGEVRLVGEVFSPDAVARALQIASGVPGVEGVTSEIAIVRPRQSAGSPGVTTG